MAAASPPSQGLFSAPAPIRSLFKSFPLAVHPAEALPARSPDTGSTTTTTAAAAAALPRLYVFAHEQDAALGLPSYNPSCLKWQTILRIANINTLLIPSSNHASPSGALPFLIVPGSSSPNPTTNAQPAAAAATPPLTGEKIARYARQHAPSANLDDPSPRIDAYQALIAHSIRPAWLYALYVNPANDALLTSLYLPSSPLLRPAQRRTLRAAATAEILKATRRTAGGIDVEQLYDDAEAAFSALSSALLGDDDDDDNNNNNNSGHEYHDDKDGGGGGGGGWFLGASSAPGVLDAEVFSYTHLLVGGQLAWRDDELVRRLKKFDSLVCHAERLYRRYWQS